MSIQRRIAMVLGMVALLGGSVTAVSAEEWDLDGIDRIVLDGVSGDVIVKQGAGRVEMSSDVRPRENFQANVERKGSTLHLEEDWSGTASGEVTWTFYVSGKTAVEIQTASGSLQARDVALDIEFSSASGDIELRNVDLAADSEFSTASGDYNLQDMTLQDGSGFSTASGDILIDHVDVERGVAFSTASGDVEAVNSKGVFRLSSASGDVTLRDSSVFEGSSFSSASGDVSLFLDDAPQGGISASSASGDVFLDGAGNLGGGYTLVLVADMKKGDIDTPFDYTSERIFQKNRRDYMEKIVDLGSGGPEISLETSSGRVKVRN